MTTPRDATIAAELLLLNAEAARCTTYDTRWAQAHAEIDALIGMLVDTLAPTT